MKPVLRLLRDAVFGDPVVKAQERIHAAMVAIAKCKGDLAEARQMVSFYHDRVMGLDPYKSWWEFAAARGKLEEYTIERDALGDLLQQLYQRLNKVEDNAHASNATATPAAKAAAIADAARGDAGAALRKVADAFGVTRAADATDAIRAARVDAIADAWPAHASAAASEGVRVGDAAPDAR